MRSNRKISAEARQDVAVVVAPPSPGGKRHKGKKMAGGLGFHTRREILEQMIPKYREASTTQKRQLLDEFTRLTGYHRRYAMWLLQHHTEQGQQPCVSVRPRKYGSEVEDVLVQVWEKTNRLCSKRLIPFLPTMIDAFERHEHLHLTQECRSQLLSMSAATADRMLRPHRQREMRGLCTTRAGTLLKSNIPLRTFEQWDEQIPGFVEADLVAHCDSSVEGIYLFTLTMTDIATGWTECFPLRNKSAEAVLAAVQQARQFFPFPLLGLDTDNGTEFINDALLTYCEAQQITFTRGRPLLKNDQCYVEQKNGQIVRQVVGTYRYVGEQAFQRLHELYRILSQYVNSFQPSMKLCAKLKEGRKVRRIYDTAKTPLTRLLLTQVLSAEHQRDLMTRFKDLDPVSLFEQAQQAQQALFRCATSIVPPRERSKRLFGDERFRVVGTSLLPSAAHASLHPEPLIGQSERVREDETSALLSLLEWHRTCNDPFQEQWEVIAEWVRTQPERSCRAMFEELRRLSPDRYQPSHVRTLQRGVRKIRARLPHADVRPQENVHDAEVAPSLVSDEHDIHASEGSTSMGREEHEPQDAANEPAVRAITCSLAVVSAHTSSFLPSFDAQEALRSVQELTPGSAPEKTHPANEEQAFHASAASNPSTQLNMSCKNPMRMTIGDAIGGYLEAQQRAKRRPKTMEWHQTALDLFGQYLRTEGQCVLLAEMTERHVHGWLESLRISTTMGRVRSDGTIASYARSVRAWCHWLVNAGYITRMPFATNPFLRVEPPVMHPLEMEEWERLLLACSSPAESRALTQWGPARNRALLWVLYDTGMRLSEVCALRLGDADLEQGMLLVRRNGFKGRWLPLGHDTLEAVRVYLDQHRLSGRRVGVEQKGVSDKPLFLSETGKGMTENGIVLLFSRLRRRAGLIREDVGPTLVRDSFAVRYLQAEGNLFTLRDCLGQRESAAVTRYLRKSKKKAGEYET
jgi:site-specific recombinase XerD